MTEAQVVRALLLVYQVGRQKGWQEASAYADLVAQQDAARRRAKRGAKKRGRR